MTPTGLQRCNQEGSEKSGTVPVAGPQEENVQRETNNNAGRHGCGPSGQH